MSKVKSTKRSASREIECLAFFDVRESFKDASLEWSEEFSAWQSSRSKAFLSVLADSGRAVFFRFRRNQENGYPARDRSSRLA